MVPVKSKMKVPSVKYKTIIALPIKNIQLWIPGTYIICTFHGIAIQKMDKTSIGTQVGMQNKMSIA